MCRHDTTGLENIPKICFSTQVLPIILNNCAISGCHTGSNGKGEGEDPDLSNVQSILNNVSPGKPGNSKIYNAITSYWSPMPPASHTQLTQDQRNLIYIWILQGADTACVN